MSLSSEDASRRPWASDIHTSPACRSAPATRALTYPTAVLPYVWLALESDWLNAAFFAVSVAAAAAVLRVAALCILYTTRSTVC